MKSVHSITGIPGSKKKRLPKNSGVFLLVSDSHTLGFPNPERLRRSEVCRMDIYHMLQSKNEFYVLYEFIEFYEIFVPTEKKIEKADGIIYLKN